MHEEQATPGSAGSHAHEDTPAKDDKDGKVAMPADGKGGPIVRSDGVSDTAHGRTGGGESGGGAYTDPHIAAGVHGEGGGADGGQSVKGYYGPDSLDGKRPEPKEGEPVDKGSGGSG